MFVEGFLAVGVFLRLVSPVLWLLAVVGCVCPGGSSLNGAEAPGSTVAHKGAASPAEVCPAHTDVRGASFLFATEGLFHTELNF